MNGWVVFTEMKMVIMKSVQIFFITVGDHEEFYNLWNLERNMKKNYAFSSLNGNILSGRHDYLSKLCNAEHGQCKKLPGRRVPSRHRYSTFSLFQ